MSSFDGGESADQGRPAAGRTPDDRPDDHDPVRNSPPADPWLTEAPTSVVGDATSSSPAGPAGGPAPGQVPLADTARFDDAVPFDSPPSGWGAAPPSDGSSSGWGAAPPPDGSSSSWGAAPPPEGRRGRRATRWIVAVLAVAALFIAGMLALDQFGSGSGGDRDALGTVPSPATSTRSVPEATRTRTKPAPTVTSAPSATAGNPAGGQPSTGTSAGPDDPAAGPVVIYEVTASGSKNTGSVSYTDQDGDIIRRGGIPLPWRTTFSLGDRRKPPLVLISQRKGGGDAGPVTCTITLDGKVLSSTTAEGRYASAQCSG